MIVHTLSKDKCSKLTSHCSLSRDTVFKSTGDHRFIQVGLSLNLLSSSFSSCHLKLVIPIPLHCLHSFPSFFHEAHPSEIPCFTELLLLNMWQMKVKTGLQSNPSRLFVSFGHWETSDVVLPCWRGREGREGERWRRRKRLSSVPSSNENQ